nr:hypothetical protein [Tanacetum cinerariifolium]
MVDFIAASPLSEGEACLTASGFIADQDRATIAKSSTLPHDSAPRVTSPTADEGKEEIGRLKERVQVLEDREGVATKQSGEDAPIKGRSNNEGEAAAERISNDSEEIARVLTSMDAATVLAGEIDVPIGSDFIPTAGPPATVISTGSKVGPTASPIVTRKKGKEVMVESDTPKKNKLQEQINAQIARELEEQQEKEDMRMNEQIDRDAEVEDFIPMGSKEETERLKRKGLNLEKEQVKKQKSSEEPAEIETISKEFTEEKIKEMMQLVPVKDVSACYQFFVDLLRQLDREDLNQLWALVKEYLSIRPASSDKEMELWVELKRMYEPDPEDQLWTLTQNYIHAPVEWKLYDLSEVHHVTAKDKEIFMLVEKDYPLRRGLALVMISYRLQVKNYSQMAEDLLKKIYNIANTPRKQRESSHWQYKFLLPVKVVPTARRIEIPLPGVCTAIEEMMKKLPVKDRWQLH